MRIFPWVWAYVGLYIYKSKSIYSLFNCKTYPVRRFSFKLIFFLFAFTIFQSEQDRVFGKENKITNDDSYQTITLSPGETKSIYFYINLKGKVFYKIISKSGTNKINCWWIKGPFGTVEGIGALYNQGSISYKGLVWGRLKASGADSQTTILITDNAQVAINFPSIHFK